MIAAVLAGGKSSRFGRNKLEEPIDGIPMLARVIRSVRPHVSEVWLVGSHGPSGLIADKIVADVPEFPGPLGGVVAALKKEPAESLFFLAGDLPFLTREGLDWFFQAADPTRLSIPVTSDGYLQVLHSLCPVAVASKLIAKLDQSDIRSLDYFFRLVDPLVIPVPDRFSGHFFNLNTPEDLPK